MPTEVVQPDKSRTPIVVYFFILVNIGVFVYGFVNPSFSAENALIPNEFSEEPWTLLTTGFLHAGILHIFMNMFILWQVGRGIEERFGSIAFAALYFVTLFGSSIAILTLSAPETATVGASGAIFGLIGFLLLVTARETVISLVVFLVLNLIITFTLPNISWQGHLGGLVTGLVIGLVVRLRQMLIKHDQTVINQY